VQQLREPVAADSQLGAIRRDRAGHRVASSLGAARNSTASRVSSM
jgi:hypothetical protein